MIQRLGGRGDTPAAITIGREVIGRDRVGNLLGIDGGGDTVPSVEVTREGDPGAGWIGDLNRVGELERFTLS